MQLDDIKARVVRLDEVVRGLAREIVVIKAGDDPLLHLERRRYLKALRAALAGLDQARVVLAGVAGRPEKGRV